MEFEIGNECLSMSQFFGSEKIHLFNSDDSLMFMCHIMYLISNNSLAIIFERYITVLLLHFPRMGDITEIRVLSPEKAIV